MYTIYWLKSIDGIKLLSFKRSVSTAESVKLEELCREVAVRNVDVVLNHVPSFDLQPVMIQN